VFAVNASVVPHSYRLESVGIRVYRTYYEHAAKYIHYALSLIRDDPELYLERKRNVLNKLKPYAIPGNDIKYASLLTDNGYYYLRRAKEYERAREYFRRAQTYSPDYGLNLVYLMEANFQLKDFVNAYKNAAELIRLGHPDERKALRFGIHCALEAGLRAKAQEHCEAYLADFPDDEMIQMVNERLAGNGNIEELKALFASGN
jgi:tetratricopeptide (TPR) repeat protein